MELKAVLFDLDDTLYGSFHACNDAGCAAVGAYAAREFGVDAAEFDALFRDSRARIIRQQPGMPINHDRTLGAQLALERMGLNAIRHARHMHRVYWQAAYDTMEIRPGVVELLDDLRAHGVKTAVCTDMLADVQSEKLELLGLADKVDFLVSSEEAGWDKPGAPIFRLALRKCGCLPENAVMVGDNFKHDIQGAMDVGLAGVWLNWNEQPRPTDTRPYTEVQTFAQAGDYIRTLL